MIKFYADATDGRFLGKNDARREPPVNSIEVPSEPPRSRKTGQHLYDWNGSAWVVNTTRQAVEPIPVPELHKLMALLIRKGLVTRAEIEAEL